MKTNQGSILLLPFPFTNQQDVKIRPALVVSSNKVNEKLKDVWVTSISSQKGENPFLIPLSENDLSLGKLKKNSWVKYNIVFAVEKSLIRKKVGEIKKDKLEAILLKMQSVLKIED